METTRWPSKKIENKVRGKKSAHQQSPRLENGTVHSKWREKEERKNTIKKNPEADWDVYSWFTSDS